MKQYVFALNGNRVECFLVEKTEIKALEKKYELFSTKADAIARVNSLNKATEIKAIQLTSPRVSDERRQEINYAQKKWAREQMTETEKAFAKANRPKNEVEKIIEQFEFAAKQENWDSRTYKRKKYRLMDRLKKEYAIATERKAYGQY